VRHSVTPQSPCLGRVSAPFRRPRSLAGAVKSLLAVVPGFDVADLQVPGPEGRSGTVRINTHRFHLTYPFHHDQGPEAFGLMVAQMVQRAGYALHELSLVEETGYSRALMATGPHTNIAVHASRGPVRFRINSKYFVIGDSRPDIRQVKSDSQWAEIWTNYHRRDSLPWQMVGPNNPLRQTPPEALIRDEAQRERRRLAKEAYERFSQTNTSVIQRLVLGLGGSQGSLNWFTHIPEGPLVADYIRLNGGALVIDDARDPGRVAKTMQECLNNSARRASAVIFVLGDSEGFDFDAFYTMCGRIVTGRLAYRTAGVGDIPLSTWRPNLFVFAEFPPQSPDYSVWAVFLAACPSGSSHMLVPWSAIESLKGAAPQFSRPNPKVLALPQLRAALCHYKGDRESLRSGMMPAERAMQLLHYHFTPYMLQQYYVRGFRPELLLVSLTAFGEEWAREASVEEYGVPIDVHPVDPHDITKSIGRKVRIGNAFIASIPIPPAERLALPTTGFQKPALSSEEIKEIVRASGQAGPEEPPAPMLLLGAAPGSLVPFPAATVPDGGEAGDVLQAAEAFVIAECGMGTYTFPIRTSTPLGPFTSEGYSVAGVKTLVVVDWTLPSATDVYLTLRWIEDMQVVYRLRADDVLYRRFSPAQWAITHYIESGRVHYMEADPDADSWRDFKATIAMWCEKAKAADCPASELWWKDRFPDAQVPSPAPPDARAPESPRYWAVYARSDPVADPGPIHARQQEVCISYARANQLTPNPGARVFTDICLATVPLPDRPGLRQLLASGARGLLLESRGCLAAPSAPGVRKFLDAHGLVYRVATESQ
jgi:hypothetical protein